MFVLLNKMVLLYSFFFFIIWILISLLSIIFSISFYTLGERKLMASAQRRLGPNVQGYQGILQPFADGLKLIIKEIIVPFKASYTLFFLAPIFFLTISLLSWVLIPFNFNAVLVDVPNTMVLLFMFSSLSVYGIIFSGWSSNSVYAFLGALRSAAQMISYEVSIGFIFLSVVLLTSSFNLYQIVLYQISTTWLLFPLLPLFIMFFISILAETNRAPFDLPESESELVAGYNVEYSSIVFAMFFLGEYSNMILMSTLTVILFLGGWSGYLLNIFNFVLKVVFFLILLVLVRATLPRYRYDQLMSIGWNNFLPFVLGYFFFLLGVLVYFQGLLILS